MILPASPRKAKDLTRAPPFRILAPEQGTAAVTRVIIESGDGEGRIWQTVGVSGNIIDASYNALHDAITWKLFIDGARAPEP